MENKKEINKTVNLDLTTIDSNIFAIFGAFSRQARREKWTQQEIDAVLEEAKSGDYDHAIATISEYCLPEDDSNSENEDY